MLQTYALIAGMAVAAVAVAQDRNTIQSCLAYEMAALLQSAPEGLTDEQAFAAGRELAYRIPEPLFAAIRGLPDLQETGHALVQAAQQSALSLSRQLTRQAVQREVVRCRTIFSPQAERRIPEDGSSPAETERKRQAAQARVAEPSTTALPPQRLIVLGSAEWCNLSLQRYAECVHSDWVACKRTGDECRTRMAVQKHNDVISHTASTSAPAAPPVPDPRWQMTGDGEWCLIWGRTAECQYWEMSCGGRGTECRRRVTLN